MKRLRFLSVCSGLEGASLAVDPLGWTPVGFSEIEAFPAAIIAERYGSNLPGDPLSRNAPPNFGDFTKIPLAELGAVDVLIGGTPCQAFSVAGKRLSLDDARGNLTLAYVVLAHELARSHGLRNAIWENVPGVLNTKDNAFGCFLGALVGHDTAFPQPRGAGWPCAGMVDGPRGRAAWRVLDAQFFGLAQRRERVFVVCDFGNGADPVEVLFEPASLQGNFAPGREAGERVAGPIAADSPGGSGYRNDADTAENIVAFGGGNRSGPVAQAATALGFNPDSGITSTLQAEQVPAIAFSCKDSGADASVDLSPTLRAGGFTTSHANAGVMPAVAFDLRGREGGAQFEGPHETANIRAASGGSSRSYVAQQWAVRRLTPTECERLQGVTDGHTKIAWRGKPADECPDGPRYKALGNSWAIPVVRWICARVDRAIDARTDAAFERSRHP